MSDLMTELFGEPIYVYTRAEAITDGALIDVSEVAAEAGFTIPVAVSAAAWADCVAWDEAVEDRKPEFTAQDEAGRLWDVVGMCRFGLRRKAARGELTAGRYEFELLRVPPYGRGVRPRQVTLVADLGGGDAGEPVLTIMVVGED
jgi:hypothetical protein